MRISIERPTEKAHGDSARTDGGAPPALRGGVDGGMPPIAPPAELVALQRQIEERPAREDPERVREAGRLGISGASGPLPYLDKIQNAFGRHDVSGIVAHTDEAAVAGAGAMGAAAFTMGHHVAFASVPSLHTAAHEAAHVVQQRGGVDLPGGVGRVGDRYERQADEVAERVVAGQSGEALLGSCEAAAGARRQEKICQQLEDKVQQAFGAELLSGREKGATAVALQLSPAPGTATEPDPNALIPLDDFLAYVEAVENAYPSDSPEEVLTRIRQQYYGGARFQALIPFAPIFEQGPPAPPPRQRGGLSPMPPLESGTSLVKRVLDPRIGKAAWEHLTARADENPIPGRVHQDNPSPYIIMPDRSQIDVGHLFLALDALLHPDSVYDLGCIPSIDPAGVVADIGLASFWMNYHREKGKPAPDAPKLAKIDLYQYYKASAPEADLLGDIDAFGAKQKWDEEDGEKLSVVLTHYYKPGKGAPAGTDRRYRTFCKQNGFGYALSQGKITWRWGLRSILCLRINHFCEVYAALVGFLPASWPDTPLALEFFLLWLKERVEAEIAAHP